MTHKLGPLLALVLSASVMLARCAGGSAPSTCQPDATAALELAQQTRHTLPAGPAGDRSTELTLPRGHLVLAWGWRSAERESSSASIRMTAAFSHDAGARWQIRAPLSTDGDDSGAAEGWREIVVEIPRHLAGRSGTLSLEVSSGGWLSRRFGSAAGREHFAAVPITVPQRPPGRPNILLISFDTLRADGLGCYGNPRPASPAIDRLALDGVLCREAFAPSNWTLPSHYSMMTSLYPSAHGLNPSRAEFAGFLPDRAVRVSGTGPESMLAERLQELGYFTAAVTEDGWVDAKFGFHQGFASYVADPAPDLARTRERTLRWLREHRDLPFFLFVHTYQTHLPYDQPAPYDSLFIDTSHIGYALPGVTVPIGRLQEFQPGFYPPMEADVRALRALYHGGVRYLDDFVEALIETLEELGLARNTLLVLTSDHGEELFEHGRVGHHREVLYDEVLRVPLILWGPEIVGRGLELAGPTTLLDIFPTLVEVAGGDPGGTLQGRSLLAMLRGEATSPRPRTLFAEVRVEESAQLFCLRRGADKYLLFSGSPPREELYDLSRDPDETLNLAARYPGKAARYREEIEAWQEANRALRAEFERGEQTLDEDVLERLRSLGYIQ